MRSEDLSTNLNEMECFRLLEVYLAGVTMGAEVSCRL